MTTYKNSTSPSLRIPLPPPLSHEEITFVPSRASIHNHRLPDEVAVAIGLALCEAVDARVRAQEVQGSVWGAIGRIESVQRSER